MQKTTVFKAKDKNGRFLSAARLQQTRNKLIANSQQTHDKLTTNLHGKGEAMNMKAHNKEHNKEEQPYMSEKLVIFNRIYKEYNEIYHEAAIRLGLSNSNYIRKNQFRQQIPKVLFIKFIDF